MFEWIRRRFRSLNRGGYAEEGGQRVENADAMAQAGQVGSPGSGGGMPPDYVKSYDEGRPPH
jgi:hypothetical protein